MKIIYNNLLLLFLLLASMEAISQITHYDQVNRITPPSPDATALGKYGAIPVGLYNGIPQINIPLYDAKEGDIDLNLSLSYMSGGIKVEDIASWVGLGWTLNCGGVITRSIKGKPDDQVTGYFDPHLLLGPRPTGADNSLSNESKWRLSSGADDGESDVYYFNFDGHSGSFYFDTNRQPRFFNHTDLKIIPYMTANIRLDSFKVVTEKGIEYIFDKKEDQSSATKTWVSGQNEPTQYYPDGIEYTSAWYLSKIRSPSGFQVTFEYDEQPKQVSYEILGSERSYVRIQDPYSVFDPSFEKTSIKTRKLLNTIFVKRLTKIVLSNGYIEFNVGADRTDIPHLSTLGDISIFNNNNKLLKKYSFAYHYYSDRLMLDNITESNGDIMKPPYKFYYDESRPLPDRESYAQDHWGYYNGHLENNTLIPSFGVGEIYKPGANRNVDTASSKLGILKQIDYPTKGSTVLEYESNVAYNVNKFPLYDQQHVAQDMHTFPALVEVPNWYTPVLVPIDTLYFTIHNAGNITDGTQPNGVWADVSMQLPYDYSAGIGFVGAQYELWDTTTGTKILTNADIGNPISSQDYGHGNIAYNYKKAKKMFLQNEHTYKLLEFVKPDVYNRFNAFPYYFLIEYNLDIAPPSDDIIVGGLRVKSIIDVDPVTKKKIKKSYYYTNGINSTGYLLDYPRYFYDYHDLFTGFQIGCGPSGPDRGFTVNQAYRVALSNSYYPLATTKNAYIGYNQVTEFTNDTLKTIYKYTSAAEYDNQDKYEWNGTYLPISSSGVRQEAEYRSYDWKRGLLTQKSEYRLVNSIYVPSRIEDHYYTMNNDYEKPNYHEAYNFTAAIFQNDWYGTGGGNTCGSKVTPYTNGFPECTSNFYRNVTGYAQEDSIIIRNYDTSDISKMSILKTEMFYDTLTLQANKIIVKNSNGNVKTTYLKYPPNYNISEASTNTSLGIKNLVQKNVIQDPVETYVISQTTRGTVLVSGELRSYRPDIPKLDTVFILENPGSVVDFEASSIVNGSFKKNSNYKKRFIFNKYDKHDNILESFYVNGAKSSYLWGYKQQYPIAKITNSAYQDIFYENFEDGLGNSTFGDAKTGNYSKSGGFSKSLIGLTNGKYILTYWMKSDASWTLVTVNNIDIINSSYVISLGNSNLIDDVMFCPKGASTSTYTYDPLIGMTSETDAKGMTVYYEYDSLQRLKTIKDNNGKIVKHMDYHYQGQ